jgi:hypothetical protein
MGVLHVAIKRQEIEADQWPARSREVTNVWCCTSIACCLIEYKNNFTFNRTPHSLASKCHSGFVTGSKFNSKFRSWNIKVSERTEAESYTSEIWERKRFRILMGPFQYRYFCFSLRKLSVYVLKTLHNTCNISAGFSVRKLHAVVLCHYQHTWSYGWCKERAV